MAIKIEMLRCFVAVAESGKLADAAARLHRTPSAVSMMLKQFEDHLGQPLFETERKSKLTALGAFVLEEARAGLAQFARSSGAIEAFARAEAGFVRVAAVPSVAETLLPRAVRDFLRARPGVLIDIQDMHSAAVLREVAREGVDLGLASVPADAAAVAREALFSDAFGVVCRRDHPLAAAAAPLPWSALAPYPFIANGICERVAHPDFRRVLEAARLRVRNTTSLLAMVRADLGITLLPRLALVREEGAQETGAGGDDVQEGTLRFRPVADPEARRRIELLRPAGTALSPAAQRFAAALRRAAAERVA